MRQQVIVLFLEGFIRKKKCLKLKLFYPSKSNDNNMHIAHAINHFIVL